MTRTMAQCTARLLLAGALIAGAGPASAQTPTPVVTRAAHAKLGWVGVLTMIGGGLMMLPYKTQVGAEDWTLNGRPSCVVFHRADGSGGNEFSLLHDGFCETTHLPITAGLVTLGTGAGLTWLGFRKVQVAPTFGARRVGATVAVQW